MSTAEMSPIENSESVEHLVPSGDTPSSSMVPSDDRGGSAVDDSTVVPKRVLPRNEAFRHIQGVALHLFQISADAKVVPYEGEISTGLAHALSDKKQPTIEAYWLHIDANERHRTELNEWIDRLDLVSFIADQLKRPADQWLSHVGSSRTTALVMIRILPEKAITGKFVAHEVEYLAAVMKNRALLTFTTSEGGSGNTATVSREAMTYLTQDDLLHNASSSAVLLAWLEFHVLRTRMELTILRKRALLLLNRMDQDPSSIQLKDIVDVANNLLVVLSVAEEQAQSLAMLASMDEDVECVDFMNLEGVLSILVKTAESTERMGQRTEKRLNGLKHSFDAYQQDQLNRRLAMLTAVSTIFLPLTFFAGVYGMNFENMPELRFEYGYFICVGAMVVLAGSMVVFFYKNGWFS